MKWQKWDGVEVGEGTRNAWARDLEDNTGDSHILSGDSIVVLFVSEDGQRELFDCRVRRRAVLSPSPSPSSNPGPERSGGDNG